MKVKEQFCKWAKEYHNSSIVQQKCAQILVEHLPKDIGVVLDLGCGSGRVYEQILEQNINYTSFLGVDFAKDMLAIHKQGRGVKLIEGDFNKQEIFNLVGNNFDTVLSASALQWANDLNFVFKNTSNMAKLGAFCLFGSNTFKTIHKIVNIKSPIYTIDTIQDSFNNYYTPRKTEVYNFKLEFSSTLDMLRYIKKSGINGGGFGLKFSQINKILKEYPYNYLEFETILLIGDSNK
jgi:malonyl-CoA O-methyltransferase